MRVTQFFPASTSPAEFERFFRVEEAAHLLDRPGDPPPSLSAVIDRLTRPLPPGRAVTDWVARSATGLMTGTGYLMTLGPRNPHLAAVEVTVHPDHRRHGIGTALLARMATEAAADGKSTLLVEGLAAGGPGAGFASTRGFVVVQRTARLRLDMPTVDRSRWHVPLARGYRLARWVDSVPEDLLVSYAMARNAISTAPHGQTTFVDQEWTPQQIRSTESTATASRQTRVVVAVHEATGEVAGLTFLEVQYERPHVAVQQDTVVLPAHRGKRLGVSMKAANLAWLAADHPQVSAVHTSVAAENAYMLRVNVQVGFTVEINTEIREAEISALLAGLGEQG